MKKKENKINNIVVVLMFYRWVCKCKNAVSIFSSRERTFLFYFHFWPRARPRRRRSHKFLAFVDDAVDAAAEERRRAEVAPKKAFDRTNGSTTDTDSERWVSAF